MEMILYYVTRVYTSDGEHYTDVVDGYMCAHYNNKYIFALNIRIYYKNISQVEKDHRLPFVPTTCS